MGIMQALGALFFGGGRNVVKETAEVFVENVEAGAQRDANYRQAALAQYGKEFYARNNRTWLDAFADALNRLVRPVLTILLFYPVAATVRDPAGMVVIWQALATVPEAYLVLLGSVVLFYFGGRMQEKSLNASTFRTAAQAVATLAAAESAAPEDEAEESDNAALDAWKST